MTGFWKSSPQLMEKIGLCIKNMGVYHSFEKMKPQLCFYFKKPFSS